MCVCVCVCVYVYDVRALESTLLANFQYSLQHYYFVFFSFYF